MFCNSTKSAERAADAVSSAAAGSLLAGQPAMAQHLLAASRSLQHGRLASLVASGVGFHISTLSTEDRRTVERL